MTKALAQSPAVSVLRYGDAKASIDVSIVITFHREGLYAKWMLDGFQRVRAYAEISGLQTQLVCVLDHPDDDTLGFVGNHPILVHNDWVLKTQTGDPGTNRNIGVAYASGEYIGVADGDDYYCEHWVSAGYALASRYGASVVVHPEYVVSFESQHVLARLIDQRDGTYPMASCLLVHPWVCSAIAHSAIFKTTRYLPTNARETGFGFEDWHWNLEVLAKGVWHVLAPDTALYYRRKETSVLVSESAHRAVIRPTAFFDRPECWESGFPLVDEYRQYAKTAPDIRKNIGIGAEERGRETGLRQDDFPEWIRDDFAHLSEIEAALNPTPEFFARFHCWSPPAAAELGQLYASVLSRIPINRCDVILVVPWLEEGDSGERVLQYIGHYARRFASVLLITTAPIVSHRPADMAPQVQVLEFGRLVLPLPHDDQALLLARLFLQLRPALIRNVNSELCARTYRRYGRALRSDSIELLTSVFLEWAHGILDASHVADGELLMRIRLAAEQSAQRDAMLAVLDHYLVEGEEIEDRVRRAAHAYREMVAVQTLLMNHEELAGEHWEERLRQACDAARQTSSLQGELATILYSRSWKYTAPLRSMHALLRRILSR